MILRVSARFRIVFGEWPAAVDYPKPLGPSALGAMNIKTVVFSDVTSYTLVHGYLWNVPTDSCPLRK
jgi:hypothetical protein